MKLIHAFLFLLATTEEVRAAEPKDADLRGGRNLRSTTPLRCASSDTHYEMLLHGNWIKMPMAGGTKCCPSSTEGQIEPIHINVACPTIANSANDAAPGAGTAGPAVTLASDGDQHCIYPIETKYKEYEHGKWKTRSTAQGTKCCPHLSGAKRIIQQDIDRDCPSNFPSLSPSSEPSANPSAKPSSTPSSEPSASPSAKPSSTPSSEPSASPSAKPSPAPTFLVCSEDADCPSGRCEATGGPLNSSICLDQLSNGSGCNEGSDCLSGRCDLLSFSTRSVCQAQVPNDSRCNEASDCLSGRCELFFTGSFCQAQEPNGDNCNEDGDCLSGRCDGGSLFSSAKCKAKLPDSSGCNEDSDCASGRCGSSGGCQPRKTPNYQGAGSCNTDSDCASGRCDQAGGFLSGSQCYPKVGTGSSCNEASDCLSSRCDIAGIFAGRQCYERLGSGASCNENNDCLSFNCQGGVLGCA